MATGNEIQIESDETMRHQSRLLDDILLLREAGRRGTELPVSLFLFRRDLVVSRSPEVSEGMIVQLVRSTSNLFSIMGGQRARGVAVLDPAIVPKRWGINTFNFLA